MTLKISSKLIYVLLFAQIILIGPSMASSNERIQIQTDFSEADAVLAILAKRAASDADIQSDFERLFATEPYRRLQKREASIHQISLPATARS